MESIQEKRLRKRWLRLSRYAGLPPVTFFMHAALAWGMSPHAWQTQAGEASPRTVVITGRVHDAETGSSLANANVLVKGTVAGALTDARGIFRLAFRQNLPVTIIFSHLGYKTKEISIDSSAALVFNVALQADLLEMDAVVVTGTFNPISKLESSVALTTLSPSEVATRPLRSRPHEPSKLM